MRHLGATIGSTNYKNEYIQEKFKNGSRRTKSIIKDCLD